MRFLVLAAAILFTATTANAETFNVIKNKTVLKSCGECHMAFPTETLSKAVWTKIIGDLSNHFGEDASMDAKTTAVVLDYHLKNASDTLNIHSAKRWRSSTPFYRITDGPRFHKHHDGCSKAVWANPKIKAKSNCVACHNAMQTSGSTRANMSFLPLGLQGACGDDE